MGTERHGGHRDGAASGTIRARPTCPAASRDAVDVLRDLVMILQALDNTRGKCRRWTSASVAALPSPLGARPRGYARALERGRASGLIRRNVEARKVAAFVVASIKGSSGPAENATTAPVLHANLEVIAEVDKTLRAPWNTVPPHARRSRATRSS